MSAAAASGGASSDLDFLLAVAKAAAVKAGEVIMGVYAGDFDSRHKLDASPVTIADELAETLILDSLAAQAPDIPAISEEAAEANGLPSVVPERYWLVDPLDGTKEFIKRNGEFTVNIGLIERGRPILGVIAVPALGQLYAAAGPGTAHEQLPDGTRRPLAVRSYPTDGIIVAHSRSHQTDARLDTFLGDRPVAGRLMAGSALKFCRVAEGAADLYPRFSPTMEWDTAAGQAILEAAGGSLTMLDGAPFRYGKPGFLNPGFVAMGGRPSVPYL
ncbi:MAG TPA: 3'(2'),5'-bisphosphate nucleotidase CysQ [Stellaceae bacterium]|nr:3'(2'),5'-bisphosphate nucleotidase CysQ [Stellaceae bacterium]